MATYSYVKKGKVRALKDPDLTDADSSSEEEEEEKPPQQQQEQQEQQEQKQEITSFWCWESNDGYQPYDMSISKKLDELNINGVYKVRINNTWYEIKKTAFDQAIQTNTNNQMYRKAIRQSNNNDNNNNNNNNKNNNNNSNIADIKELDYVWFYSDDTNSMQSCSYNISQQLNKLNIGGLYTCYINDTQYQFKKQMNDICEQRNISTNKCRTVIRQSVNKKNNNNNNNNNNNKNKIDPYKANKNNHAWNPYTDNINNYNNNYNQYNNKSKGKWHWKDDSGSFQPFTNYISSKLDSLQIGKSITITIGDNNWKYQMTKIAKDICQQKNIQSGNIREVQRR